MFCLGDPTTGLPLDPEIEKSCATTIKRAQPANEPPPPSGTSPAEGLKSGVITGEWAGAEDIELLPSSFSTLVEVRSPMSSELGRRRTEGPLGRPELLWEENRRKRHYSMVKSFSAYRQTDSAERSRSVGSHPFYRNKIFSLSSEFGWR